SVARAARPDWATEQPGAPYQAAQAEAARRVGTARAVVCDRQLHRLRVAVIECDADVRGARMFADIGQSFLCCAIECEIGLRSKRARHACDCKLDAQPRRLPLLNQLG